MNKKSFYTAIATVAFTLIAVQTASAQEKRGQEPPSATELIKQMDANEDGKLSEKEVKGPIKNDFSKIDTNEDGYLSLEELKEAPKPKRGKKQ
ncbi:EF-hand domain-containing protein [Zobellia amurskyensis]|uniref:EF-hand domain-containing protein n=1 Tax=Zobellia amurskyensis TaxID=248905 RepID=A0A7X2ZSP7_9FLAO|nr:EF-hand domain-containing protein [Zobellia amurskyensis]MUH35695.1 EF-hand domain-containing protein [Zobellia amurskyensis]